MKTAKQILLSTITPVREFFGIKPKTETEIHQSELVIQQKLINVREKAGRLYIVYHSGRDHVESSFMELPGNMTVQEVLDTLEKTRRAAAQYNIS